LYAHSPQPAIRLIKITPQFASERKSTQMVECCNAAGMQAAPSKLHHPSHFIKCARSRGILSCHRF